MSAVNFEAASDDIHRLQVAIMNMDSLAQGGFSEISAIAKLALVAMETPYGYLHPETIAQALRAICSNCRRHRELH